MPHFCIFDSMKALIDSYVVFDHALVYSSYLKRNVPVDFFLPRNVPNPSEMSLLLINDGQDMKTMNFGGMLNHLYHEQEIGPVFCVAISAGENRKMEYGVAAEADYMGRGGSAGAYTGFILHELLPLIKKSYHLARFKEMAFAGFSLGGLSALDIVWNHPWLFSIAGIFSGSLWWRSRDREDADYNDHHHRIMQNHIRNSKLKGDLKFFFQCGSLDEAEDRNNNGVVDAIDDTLDTIHEIVRKGCAFGNITYLEIADGRHDVHTWGLAMPVFLKWAWGLKNGQLKV